jgi:Cu2+-exporting ATPase
VKDLIPAEGRTEAQLLLKAAALEQGSEHPLAKALLRAAEEQQMKPDGISDFRALPGNGLEGTVGGKQLHGGSGSYISSLVSVPEELTRQAEALAEQGKTPLFFEEDGKTLGVIAVADRIREDSREGIRQLKNQGLRVVMLTGDNERTAQAIAAQAGVDEWVAGVLPEGKEEVIRKLQAYGRVAMVGDGINDAPALTRADTGIAIGAGTDVAVDSADIVLMNSSLSDVAAAVRLSRGTLRNIHENLFWAFFYNAVCIPLAMGLYGVEMKPMYGAAAMALSSFFVCMNALRLNLVKIHDASRDKKLKNKVSDKTNITYTTTNETVREEKTMTKTLKVEGMMCMHCEARVKKALEAVAGVESAAADHEKGTAVVTLSADVADELLKKAVEDQDYKVLGIE